jgi:EmrB/QacA subfamily drug resistance transporter
VGSLAVRVSTPLPALIVLSLGTFMVLLDATIVNVSIPTMMDSLRAPFDQVLWVVNAYLLVYGALLMPAGRISDLFGPRNLFVLGLAVLVAASAACGLAQSSGQLIGARVVEALGAALLAPQALVILATIFPAERRGAAFGTLVGIAGLAALVGPTLGGLLVTDAGWRWIFFVNVPVGIAAIVATYMLVPDVRPGRRPRLDIVGTLLAVLATSCLTFGVVEGQRYAWGPVMGPVTIWGVFAAGIALSVTFFVWERFQPEPLVPRALVGNRAFALMASLNTAPWFALTGFLLVFTVNNQSALGMSALVAGLTGIPLSLVVAIISPFSGRLADRVGSRYLILVGLAAGAVGLLGCAAVDSTSATPLTFTVPLAVAGLGMGLTFAPLTKEAMRTVPADLAGVASGVLNAARQVGSSFGAAILGAVLQARLAAAFPAQAALVGRRLPVTVRLGFVRLFRDAARGGLQLGAGQDGGVRVPADVPQRLVERLHPLVQAAFAGAFVRALGPSVDVAAGIMLLGAVAWLIAALVRQPGAWVTPLKPKGGEGGADERWVTVSRRPAR